MGEDFRKYWNLSYNLLSSENTKMGENFRKYQNLTYKLLSFENM